jgi:chromosome segregation ATPase
MNTTDIPDLISTAEVLEWTAPDELANVINQRHSQRMADAIAELRLARVCFQSAEDGCTKLQVENEDLQIANRQQAAEIERLRADRDRILAQSNCYAAKIERLQPDLDNAHQTIAKLQLDIGILNGRLIERTEAMGERQREYLDRARKAETALGHIVGMINEAVGHLECVRCLDSSDTMFKRDALRLLGDAIKTAAICNPNPDQK